MSFDSIPSPDKLAQDARLNGVVIWESRFQFLLCHNGLRPSRVHWLLGTTGSGKTTILKSVMGDSAREYPVLIYTTEEDVKRYGPGILKASPQVPRENLKFMSEREIPPDCRSDLKKLLTWFESRIIESGCRLVFMDNLTTSVFFSQRFGIAGQEEAVLKLSEISERLEVTFFIALHTEKKVTDNMGRLIMGEDCRGTQQSFIKADFFYILQRFEVGNVYHPFIRVVKHRDYEPKERSYLLSYANGVYTKDQSVSFDKMNEVFIQRNVLGKQKKESKAVYNNQKKEQRDF